MKTHRKILQNQRAKAGMNEVKRPSRQAFIMGTGDMRCKRILPNRCTIPKSGYIATR